MIYPQTMLTVADNGAKKGYVSVLGGNKKYAGIGDTIIAVVKEAHQICL
jgi:large subunit ribosomal protein L14